MGVIGASSQMIILAMRSKSAVALCLVNVHIVWWSRVRGILKVECAVRIDYKPHMVCKNVVMATERLATDNRQLSGMGADVG